MYKFVKAALLGAATVAALGTTAAQAQTPNLFSCENAEYGIQFGYSSSSFTGQPTFTLDIDGQVITLTPATIDPTDTTLPVGQTSVVLKVEDTIQGRLVSAISHPLFIADAPSTAYSVLIPHIHAAGNQPAIEFKSRLLVSSIGGFTPAWVPVQRLRDTYSLDCKAQAVFF